MEKMKKILFICMVLCMGSLSAFSQIKVTPDGKVGIGITQTPISSFAIGTVGDPYMRNFFQSNSGDAVNVAITGAGNSPNSFPDFGTALNVHQYVSSSRGDYGI